jgi:hypothetical protein
MGGRAQGADARSWTACRLIREYEVEGVSYEPKGQVRGLMPQTVAGGGLQSLAAVCTMCNDAEITFSDGQYTRIGEPTEAALKVRDQPASPAREPSPRDQSPRDQSPRDQSARPARETRARGLVGFFSERRRTRTPVHACVESAA